MSGVEEKKENTEEVIAVFGKRVCLLEKNMSLMADTLAAMKGQKDSEHMVVEVGGIIFKGERDVAAWLERNAPNNYPFSVNHKLNLQVDKGLLIKTFENKLSSLFGQAQGMATAIKDERDEDFTPRPNFYGGATNERVHAHEPGGIPRSTECSFDMP
eukprot:2085100-Ditylum_brightwellii.AAC.1